VDWDGFCHFHQIRPIAIGKDHLPVGMFPLTVQFSGHLIPNHSSYRSLIDENDELVPMCLTEKGQRGPGEAEISTSDKIDQPLKVPNLTNLDSFRCEQRRGSNSFVFENRACFRLWQQSNGQLARFSLFTGEDGVIQLAGSEEFIVPCI